MPIQPPKKGESTEAAKKRIGHELKHKGKKRPKKQRMAILLDTLRRAGRPVPPLPPRPDFRKRR